jgi:hypothetical protein
MNKKSFFSAVLVLLFTSRGFSQQVGIAFQCWNRDWRWGENGKNAVAEPIFGYYDSKDVEVIKKQGIMLRDANVDFVVIDWTNNIDYHPSLGHVNPDIGHIEEATVLLAETWAKIPGAPKVSIVFGSAVGITMPRGGFCDWNADGTPGPRVKMKFDQIHRTFIENPVLKKQYYHVAGKPFIILWSNPLDLNKPFDYNWQDSRFTMRHMIGFASTKPWLFSDRQGEFVTMHTGVWTWTETAGSRGLSYKNGKLDCMAVNLSAMPSTHTGARADNNNGETFIRYWDQAIEKKPEFVFIKAYNEYMVGENPLYPIAHFVIEPIKNVPNNDLYMKILRDKAAQFKGIPLATSWDFPDVPVEDWNNPHSITASKKDGIYKLAITGPDPFVYSPYNLNIRANQTKYAVVRMQNQSASTTAQLCWTTSTETGWNPAKSKPVSIVANDLIFRDYMIDLSTNPNWKGTIKQLRLHPSMASSGTVKIDFIKIVGGR